MTRMLPSGPVVSSAKRHRDYGSGVASGAAYAGGPRVESYVVPFLVFGVTYDLDLVLVTEHARWDMHEYARIATPDGPLWLAKDSLAETGNQLLVADIDDIFDWLPEIPLARKRGEVNVVDESTEKLLDLHLAYENHFGEDVEVHYVGKPPTSRQRQRNGSTMGHSREQVMAVLDVSHRDFAKRATVEIGGVAQKIHRVAGLVPMQLALRQTQGGISRAQFSCAADREGFRTRHQMTADHVIERRWAVDDADSVVTLSESSSLRTLRYEFRRIGPALELERATVVTADGNPNFSITFTPALPDLRCELSADWVGRWVMDVGDQKSHAIGTVSARTDAKGADLELLAERPWWVADRSISTRLTLEDSGCEVSTTVGPGRG